MMKIKMEIFSNTSSLSNVLICVIIKLQEKEVLKLM